MMKGIQVERRSFLRKKSSVYCPTGGVVEPTVTGGVVEPTVTGGVGSSTLAGSSNPSDKNNSTVTLTVTSTIEQSADGKSVSKITVDPADLQKAVDSLKSASGTPKIIIQVPGNVETMNILLSAGLVADIQAQVPSTVISVQYDTGSYDLPAEVLDIPAIAEELGAEWKTLTSHARALGRRDNRYFRPTETD